eukprot:4888214-Amphidinium_carterae.1
MVGNNCIRKSRYVLAHSTKPKQNHTMIIMRTRHLLALDFEVLSGKSHTTDIDEYPCQLVVVVQQARWQEKVETLRAFDI